MGVTLKNRFTNNMRKLIWLATPILLSLAFLFIFTVNSSLAADDGLSFIAPSACPEAGCAAGQRLNMQVQFSVSPKKPDPNVQVCVYTPAKGTSAGVSPWADYSNGWISELGLISGETYTPGQVSSLCEDNLDDGDEWLTGSYAQLKTASYDQLEFTFHIHPDADLEGTISVKVFEPALGNGSWEETASFDTQVEVIKRSNVVFVAETHKECASRTPCYINSGDDLTDGVGTGLRDAVLAVSPSDEIRILGNYPIKSNTVVIDKNVRILGQENAMLTYIGSECSNPMLSMTQGGTLSKLSINDGNCFSPSRTLIEIDSPDPVAIENNTLVFGKYGIYIRDNFGNVTVAFNHIVNNDDHAILRTMGKSTGTVNIFANNIINNGSGYQVNCNDSGKANHNFWGAGLSASENANNCAVSNGKRLGALIRLAEQHPGVEAQRLTVTSTMAYAFNGQIGARRTAGSNFDIIIVNHGQGSTANIPFLQSGSGSIQPCSNFFDIFLADGAVATNLILALKYNLNSECVTKIESSDFCGGANSQNYPLYWYDPATNATEGWDRTGQNPQGPGAGGVSGQETTCNLTAKEIQVVIDNTGRPSISNDLNFTPFVVGLPVVDGITLSQFTAQFDGAAVNLRWTTTSEINVKGFYVLRSDTAGGTYARISSLINAIGDTHIGGIYQFSDATIAFARTYFYKIEVIDTNGNSISTHGPVSILTSTATPTVTQTQTPTKSPSPTVTWTRSPTPTAYRSPTPYFFYRTPTPVFWPRTATPVFGPTQVRTFGPSPEGTNDGIFFPPDDFDRGTAYPLEPEATPDWEETQPSMAIQSKRALPRMT
jgi:hypothetical protein